MGFMFARSMMARSFCNAEQLNPNAGHRHRDRVNRRMFIDGFQGRQGSKGLADESIGVREARLGITNGSLQ